MTCYSFKIASCNKTASYYNVIIVTPKLIKMLCCLFDFIRYFKLVIILWYFVNRWNVIYTWMISFYMHYFMVCSRHLFGETWYVTTELFRIYPNRVPIGELIHHIVTFFHKMCKIFISLSVKKNGMRYSVQRQFLIVTFIGLKCFSKQFGSHSKTTYIIKAF